MFPKSNYVKNQNLNSLSLYVHWPYCESKCPYCDFNSHLTESINNKDWIKSYINQLNEKDLLDLQKLLSFEDEDLFNFYRGLNTNIEFEENNINSLFKKFKYVVD